MCKSRIWFEMAIDFITPKIGVLSAPSVRDSDPGLFDLGVIARIITSNLTPLRITQTTGKASIRSVVFPNPGPPSQQDLLTVNTIRLGLYLFNNSPTATLYVKLTFPFVPEVVNPSSFTFFLPPGGLYVTPYPAFQGPMICFWDPVAVTDNVQITEIVL
jgi:hypothetical protein